MKTLLSLLLLIASPTLRAQTYQTLVIAPSAESSPTRQVNIPVAAGETIQLLGWAANSPNADISITVGEAAFVPIRLTENIGSTFAGPATVTVNSPISVAVVFTYKLTTIANVAAQAANALAVEIPANSIAPVDVILEKSDDLLTWIAAIPGNYPVAPLKRFFRVRTVLH